MKSIRHAALAVLVMLGFAFGAHAQNIEKIRKNLTERLPQLGMIDEVTMTPMPGLFEVRIGTDLFYSDADGNFLIQGNLIDARQQRNLTEERSERLLNIAFDKLPMKDAFTIVRGNG